jgi:hypothetical protein
MSQEESAMYYNIDSITYDGYSTEDGLTGVTCALPDLRYVFYVALGAVVVAAALVMWVLRR